MLIKIRKGWELSESQATSENDFINRRSILKGFAGAGMLASAGALSPFRQALAEEGDPSAGLYPVPRNELYTVARKLTPEKIATTYNNFYEFGSHKNISKAAQALPIRPWTVKITGMVEKEMEIDIDDLLAKMPLEERIYRHRCVEAWSMAVPWSGFALKELVKLAAPTSNAKYLVMKTFENKAVAPGQRQFWYPWPYTEGLTMEEATNDLSFMVTGMYGKPVPKQNGAPLRLAAPWKYGFKQAKSLVSFHFSDKRPVTFWEKLNASEYGFWANVNPEVDHPRWSQATERDIGTGERVPTIIYNGYGEFVADMYKDIKGQNLFI
ncbi:protein-methionine-sulfoxide reductase catalytic subunit MsrP [Sneathiella marina]|uniref:Protein-methionine-sulfoxide reductase catalytic subunit MsrP n=1 Tax=Sneathiella marina TaxID=2950108 RepID=A0ABY4W5C1_9PROT|nr:protein-methionine-sulfoxide reductase catalytic subunit MsrP [Sneathiella marina]USG62391.1 protein-methionine-sulfoxide reductase catalytic subunit MsrP [Sneathiella marina]